MFPSFVYSYSANLLLIDEKFNYSMSLKLFILTRRQLTAIGIPILSFFLMATLFFILVEIIIDPSIDEPEDDFEPPVAVRILLPLSLFLLGSLAGLIGVFYYYPEIRNRPNSKKLKENPEIIDIVKYISNEEETRVISAIEELSKGAYQFEIANLSDLSRMKVHRVIKRLVERDILHKDGEGRNSKIYLSQWISKNS